MKNNDQQSKNATWYFVFSFKYNFVLKNDLILGVEIIDKTKNDKN